MKGVQCYELFGGMALKNHTFSYFFSYEDTMQYSCTIGYNDTIGHDDIVGHNTIQFYQCGHFIAVTSWLLC